MPVIAAYGRKPLTVVAAYGCFAYPQRFQGIGGKSLHNAVFKLHKKRAVFLRHIICIAYRAVKVRRVHGFARKTVYLVDFSVRCGVDMVFVHNTAAKAAHYAFVYFVCPFYCRIFTRVCKKAPRRDCCIVCIDCRFGGVILRSCRYIEKYGENKQQCDLFIHIIYFSQGSLNVLTSTFCITKAASSASTLPFWLMSIYAVSSAGAGKVLTSAFWSMFAASSARTLPSRL